MSRVSENSSKCSSSIKLREPKLADYKITLTMEKTAKTLHSDKSISSHASHRS